MKLKIILVILIIAAAIIFYPLPKTNNTPLPSNFLIQQYRSGGFAGIHEYMIIFTNGSVEFSPNYDTIYTSQLSSEELTLITESITNKNYKKQRQSLLGKWAEPACCDLMYSGTRISRNGKTLYITPSRPVADILFKIEEEIRNKLINNQNTAQTPTDAAVT